MHTHAHTFARARTYMLSHTRARMHAALIHAHSVYKAVLLLSLSGQLRQACVVIAQNYP